jgi:hypothetical protein
MALGMHIRRAAHTARKHLSRAVHTTAHYARQVDNAVTKARPIYEAVGRPLLQMHGVDTSHIDRGLQRYNQLHVGRILNTYDAIRALT